MALPDTFEELVSRELITRDIAERAAQVPPHTAGSLTGKLVAAGGDPQRVLRAVAELAAIPVATRVMIASSAPVKLSQTVARALRVLTACPVKIDPDGTLHVVVADTEAKPEVERLLPGCQVYLALEDQVRELLMDFYPSGASIPDGAPITDGIDVDLESTARLPAAPGASALPPTPPLPVNPASAPSVLPPAPLPPMPPSSPANIPSDPLAPRASGPFKVRRPIQDEETQRVQRAPKGPSENAALTERTPEDRMLVLGGNQGASATAVKQAFLRGIAVGAGAMGALAALAWLLMSR